MKRFRLFAEPESVSRRDPEWEWLIGGGGECPYPVATPHGRVALLVKRDSRLFVRDLGSGERVLVNDHSVAGGSETEITRYDLLEVAGTAIEIEPQLFLGPTRLGIDTTPLFLRHPAPLAGRLCEGVFLRARQGTFTAILGPAGSGKTVFLNLLNGYTRPTEGSIRIGDRYDLHADWELIRNYLGYVPQDDVMIPELTVRQSLDYRLRLKFPDMAPPVRARLIRETCLQLGFHPSRLETFLETPIGSTEAERRGLSGGERRRANIAHELVLKPIILLLDEPTSGLSSVDAEQVVALLHASTREEQITVVATLHQPNRETFTRFDDLLLLTHGGRVAYYGPAAKAVPFLEQATEDPYHLEENPAEYLLRHTLEPRDADRLVRYYRQHGEGLPQPMTEDGGGSQSRPTTSRGRRLAAEARSLWAEFTTLFERNVAVMRADRSNLWLALGQVPVLAALIWLAFLHFREDAADAERFSRILYSISQGKEPYLDRGEVKAGARGPMPVDDIVEGAVTVADSERWLISRQAAQRRGAVYFIVIAAGIWLGIIGGCREIVVEKHILRREARSYLRLGPYLAGKLAAQASVGAVQCGLLTGLIAPGLLGLSLLQSAGLGVVLWLTTVSAASLGLMISALAPTYRAALTAVPLVLIPQLLFGGLLRAPAEMAAGAGISRMAGWLTLQRWGFESALAMDRYAAKGVMLQEFNAEESSSRTLLQLFQGLRFRDGSLEAAFFSGQSALVGVVVPLLLLAAATAVFLGISRWFLERRLGLKPWRPGPVIAR